MKTCDKNIVLVGMPGCGKTTIGKVIGKRLHRSFFDVDEYIEKTSGRLIKDIFIEGEETFRNLESQAVFELSKTMSAVISTGGGTIKDFNNIKNLKENGIIFFIDRPLENIIMDLEINNRPLLKGGKDKIFKLYEERYNLYKEYCDFYIKNEGKIEVPIEEIIKVFRMLR